MFVLCIAAVWLQVLDPTWEGPKKQEANLLKYLDSITTLIDLKGKLKPKKLLSMLSTLDAKVNIIDMKLEFFFTFCHIKLMFDFISLTLDTEATL